MFAKLNYNSYFIYNTIKNILTHIKINYYNYSIYNNIENRLTDKIIKNLYFNNYYLIMIKLIVIIK